MGRSRRNWTPEEDAVLRHLVTAAVSQNRPLLWRQFAKSIPGRSNKDCRRRWCNSLADGTAKGPWSEEEDERLFEAVRQHGTNWREVARAVESRNPDQCSSHWSQVLDPNINFCDWTTEEDENLLHEVLTHGTNWATISTSHCPKRTTLILKNRYSTLRLRHGNSTKTKDKSETKTQAPTLPPPSSISENTTNLAVQETTLKTHVERIKAVHGYDKVNERGDEDEDDDAEEDDDDEEENYINSPEDGASHIPHPLSTSHPTRISISNNLGEDRVMPESGIFSPHGFDSSGTSPHLTRDWPPHSVVHSSYGSPLTLNHHWPMYTLSQEGYFGNREDTRLASTGISFPAYGGEPIELSLPPLDTPGLKPSGTASSQDNNCMIAEPKSPSRIISTTTSSMPSISRGSTCYVSIDMVCTTQQLEAVMVVVANVTTSLNVKIEPNSPKS